MDILGKSGVFGCIDCQVFDTRHGYIERMRIKLCATGKQVADRYCRHTVAVRAAEYSYTVKIQVKVFTLEIIAAIGTSCAHRAYRRYKGCAVGGCEGESLSR